MMQSITALLNPTMQDFLDRAARHANTAIVAWPRRRFLAGVTGVASVSGVGKLAASCRATAVLVWPTGPALAHAASGADGRVDLRSEGRVDSTTAPKTSDSPQARHYAPTPQIDSTHPRIVSLAQELTAGARSETEAAIRLHDAVRDRIAFGIAPAFYAMKASEVLDAGVGYCNTKSTLFCALLRARGIAARIRMLDLSAAVLTGLFDPGGARVDHAVTEVWLDGRWLGVDSYVVDPPLERAARARLAREGQVAGYGIHRDGSTRWDGRSATRIQCVESAAPAGWIGQDHGVFDDVNDFYARVPSAHNRLNVLLALFIRLGASRINQGIEKLRRQTAAA
jgi:hypothetical protein